MCSVLFEKRNETKEKIIQKALDLFQIKRLYYTSMNYIVELTGVK
jgi:hypothetical protein